MLEQTQHETQNSRAAEQAAVREQSCFKAQQYHSICIHRGAQYIPGPSNLISSLSAWVSLCRGGQADIRKTPTPSASLFWQVDRQ